MPEHLNNPELLGFVKTYQVHAGSNNLLEIQSYIINNLNPAEVNVIDPIKNNFTQPLSVKEILDELEICKDDY